jgi:protein-disulfide isomerase
LIKKFALLLIALAAVSVSAQQTPANLPSEDTVMKFVQHMIGYDPSLKFRISSIKPAEAPGFADVTVVVNNGQADQILNFEVSPDGKWALIGQMMDFGADPFARYRSLLAKPDGPVRGPKDAKVTIVEFADLECPACKAALPNVEKIQAENPNVRVIFQNFPLEKLHPWAFRAALYVDCLKTNSDVAWKFIDTVYQHQEEIKTETADTLLKQYANESGASATVAACIVDPKTKADVMASEKLGEDVAVSATPTLFVNGRKISSFNSLPYETFKQLVEYAEKNP